MAKVTLYNQEGSNIGELNLNPVLFEVAPQMALIHQAVVVQQANARQVIAHTKGRSEVRGGGRKPWKQKGTGRARHGSTRSPIWVGGGVTFGPTNERNFHLKMNRQSRRKALAMSLTEKVQQNRLVAIDSLQLELAKTKNAIAILNKLPLAGKKTLVVVEPENRLFSRATRNLPHITPISAKSLNIVDVLAHEYVLASREAIDVLVQTYSKDVK
ncbi:MAG: 50S ribosomal protein L4 [Candidatus Uhrbacteria bacterium GW2011_GWF2_41_16]|jgi:large subunit ribosomal protein L4|uniref:Large ribosomal subunit protein uL4 n=2 Tax=Candidatus Uhriibacteriota TaxID=1752732 RepID=A0A0G0VC54_9BACT|nr:MAG: 50S ribosomal protein L4 [Candidatus Uhrbacteria bacterium GW2011_GWC2_41_11]KKR98499.1 MAG: 50S ribosomal protein L4 [Candidatus Uhrbacteria bacterium GW2011_GWF2_41_16]HBO99965.1 50S ribosomal protein L4 [Candidatus Uhrbacteria bacterium]